MAFFSWLSFIISQSELTRTDWFGGSLPSGILAIDGQLKSVLLWALCSLQNPRNVATGGTKENFPSGDKRQKKSTSKSRARPSLAVAVVTSTKTFPRRIAKAIYCREQETRFTAQGATIGQTRFFCESFVEMQSLRQLQLRTVSKEPLQKTIRQTQSRTM